MSADINTDTKDPFRAYRSRSETPPLIPSIVTFIDSLGSQSMAANLEDQQRRLENLSEGIDAAHKAAALPNIDGFGATATFTDNIVVGFPIDQTGEPEMSDPSKTWAVLLRVLLSAASYQTELIRHGVFVRGGIAIGPLWMDGRIVYGPGLIDAYILEHSQAIYPRIIVSDTILELAKSLISHLSPKSQSWLDSFLITGRDGKCFINYLFTDQIDVIQKIIDDADGIEGESAKPLEQPNSVSFLEQHAAAIGEGLFDNQSRPAVYDKYLWLLNYHNFFCNKYNYPSNVLEGIDARHEYQLLSELS
jgi:hypothetical protein